MTNTKTKTIQKADYRRVGVVADYSRQDKTWERFGFTGLPVMNTDADGNIVNPAGINIHTQKIVDKDPFVRCWTKSSYTFVPFEAIDEMLGGLEKRIKETYEMPKFKIEEIVRKPSQKGNTMHWIVQTNIVDKVKNSHIKNDEMKLGLSIRNGYNTKVTLGVDVFSMRIWCKNGAFAKGRELGSQSIRHIGNNPKALLATFTEGIMKTIEQFDNVMADYNKMAATKLTERMAQHIYKRNIKTADKYFPDYYDIATPAELKKNPKAPLIVLTNEGKGISLWENYNDMTYKLWRADTPQPVTDEHGKVVKTADGEQKMSRTMQFKGIVKQETKLYSSIKQILVNPERYI